MKLYFRPDQNVCTSRSGQIISRGNVLERKEEGREEGRKLDEGRNGRKRERQ